MLRACISFRHTHTSYFRFPIRNRNTSLRIITLSKFFTTSCVDTFRILEKGRLIVSDVKSLKAMAQSYSFTHIDLGTGDGKYVYHQAKENPDKFFIGIDLHPEKMYHFSWKTGRKPAKGGGINNVVFICSSLEQLPSTFSRIADAISINLPWAALLTGLVKPDTEVLRRIVHLAKDQSDLEIVLNYTIFQNHVYAQSLGLPLVDLNYVKTTLKPVYKDQNIYIKSYTIVQKAQGTTWGKHLVLGNQRELLWIIAKIRQQQ